MKSKIRWLFLAAFVVAAAIMLRNLFPKTVEVVTAPRIHTVYDTVEVLDTVWRIREVARTKWDTVYLERYTIAKTDTVYLAAAVAGLTFLHVPQKIGDSTIAQGFVVQPLAGTDSLELSLWEAQWWTPGPFHMISLDTVPPRIDFWKPVFNAGEKPCRFWCKAGHYLTGAAAGYTLSKLEGILK